MMPPSRKPIVSNRERKCIVTIDGRKRQIEKFSEMLQNYHGSLLGAREEDATVIMLIAKDLRGDGDVDDVSG